MTLTYNLWPWNSIEVVEVHVRTKVHQAKCSGSWVINSALDFGQLYTSIGNISGMDQAINKRKTTLSTTIFSTFDENNLVNFGPLTKKWPWPLTNDLEILWASTGCQDARFCKRSSSWVQWFESYGANGEKKSDKNNTVRRYRADSRNSSQTGVKDNVTQRNVNKEPTSEMNGRKSSQNGWLTSSELATRPRTDKLFSVLCPPSCTRDTWYMQRRMGIFF